MLLNVWNQRVDNLQLWIVVIVVSIHFISLLFFPLLLSIHTVHHRRCSGWSVAVFWLRMKKGGKIFVHTSPNMSSSIICIDRDPSIFVPKWPHRYHSVLKGCYLHKAVIINTMVKVCQAFTMLFIFTIVISIEHTINWKCYTLYKIRWKDRLNLQF